MAVKMNSEHIQTFYDSTGMFTIEIKETVKSDGTHIFDNITICYKGNDFLHLSNIQDVEVLYEILYAAGVYLKHGFALKIEGQK